MDVIQQILKSDALREKLIEQLAMTHRHLTTIRWPTVPLEIPDRHLDLAARMETRRKSDPCEDTQTGE